MMEWAVGQKIYIVPLTDVRCGAPQEAEIVSIGRKWMQVEPEHLGPVSKVDGSVKPSRGYLPEAYAYPSREAYTLKVLRDEMWREIEQMFRYGKVPDGVSIEDLAQVKRILEGGE